MTIDQAQLDQLWRDRPRSIFLRVQAGVLLAIVVVSWFTLGIEWGTVFSAERWGNLNQFLRELYPYQLRDKPFSFAAFAGWCSDIWVDRGREATVTTLAISVVAMVLVGAVSSIVVFLASHALCCSSPYLPRSTPPHRLVEFAWWLSVKFHRAWFAVARAIPEYIWAFLLILVFGPTLWPAILALAIHNAGILGKLGAELIDNADTRTPSALRSMGLSRTQIAMADLAPALSPKWLAYFFYRWETCIRESVVLGMLGIATLGYYVSDARSRDWYDEMLFFILLGTALVLLIEAFSTFSRAYIRKM